MLVNFIDICNFWHRKLSRNIHSPYIENIFFCKFRIVLHFSKRVSHFFHTIPRIIKWGPNEQMFWINTKSIVAMVAYKTSFWYFAKVYFPRKSMGKCVFTIPENNTITMPVNSRFPIPTRICLFDIFKKSFSYWEFFSGKLGLHRKFLSCVIPRVAITTAGLLLACIIQTHADQIASSSFRGLNNNESSVIIDPSYAQDTLNVEVTPGGKSVKKRAGYGLYQALYTSNLQGVHGGFHFFNTVGNDVQVWASSTSVYGITSDATPVQIVSSATLNSTLDCADTQGSAYCVDSNRDFYIKTNGATLQSWSTSPLGTMVESTPDRVVVAGLSATPNTISVSGSNAFTTFTVGPLTTDPFTEAIAAPGSKLTHLRWGCGKLLWWKDQSFGWFAFEDQYTAQVKIVSDNIGTFDNTSAIDPGGNVWFRGQDGNIWEYDCSGLVKQSVEITPLVQASGRRTSDSWTQTTQSDFQSGASTPSYALSFTISPGDVVPSSFTVTENSASSGWSSGSNSNFAVGTSSLSLKTNNSGNTDNNSFENGSIGSCPDNYSCTSNAGPLFVKQIMSFGAACPGGPSACAGSFMLIANNTVVSAMSGFVAIIDANTSAQLASSAVDLSVKHCTCTTVTIASAGYIGRRVKLLFSRTDTNGTNTATLSTSFILGGDITLQYLNDVAATGTVGFDNILNGSSTITTGSFTSQIFNTGLTSTTYSLSNFAFTANTSTPTFSLLTSTSNPTNNWVTTLTSSGTNAVGNQYARYVSTITVTSADSALTSITAATIIARSSGTYYSAWKNAPNFSAWSTFNPTLTNGDGTHTFYVRASTSPQSVLNSTVTWVAQPTDSLVVLSTPGIYFQIRDDFNIGAATNTPVLNGFIVNWFDGSASDQAYMLYFDNAIWTSVAYGVGVSTNNYVFRRDLINDGWVVYSFGAGGMLSQNQHLFFGGVPSTAQIFQFGSGTSDNGTAINAYWKTKNYPGSDPFLQNQYTQIDTLARQNTNQSLTATYSLDTSTTTTSYTVNLSSTTQSVINHRKLLSGKFGWLFNIQYGDNTTSSAWEILGYRVGFIPQGYRPSQ